MGLVDIPLRTKCGLEEQLRLTFCVSVKFWTNLEIPPGFPLFELRGYYKSESGSSVEGL
jgi:hypothetical protein